MTRPSSTSPTDARDLAHAPRDAADADPIRAEITGILDTLDVPIVVVGRDCTVSRFNRAGQDALGLTTSDIGGSLCNIHALRGVNDLEKLCAQVLADGAPGRRDVRIGDRRFVVRGAPYPGSNGQIERVVLTFINVTAFRASVEQAIYEREYTKAILNTVIEPLVVLDPELRVQTANRAFFLLFGASREQTLGVPLAYLGDPDWKTSSLWAALKTAFSDDSDFQSCEIERDVPALGRRTFLLKARRLCRENIASVLLAFHDITERKRAEEELTNADHRKNEFLAMLAHELRNPLAPISNAVQVLRLSHADLESVQSACKLMERQLGQMVRMVDDLLDVSRISRGKIQLRRERIELASAVSHAVDACRPQCEKSQQKLTVTLPQQPLYVHADPTRLAQAVGNLLNNACKFTGKGGRIWLSVDREGEQAIIRVRDTGIGIAADQLPRIFDMFTQVDTSLERSLSGLGIGLTLVKVLVEMHDGTVEAHSAGVGQGSEFTVRLPILAETATTPAAKSAVPEPSPVVGRSILVVDDNRDSAVSLAMLLSVIGNRTHTANDGMEAFEAAAAFQPDVVLLDIGLPKMNGYDVARKIREQPWGKRMLLVALTGWGHEEDKRRSREAGFDAHLVKPVDLAALGKLLSRVAPVRSDQVDQHKT